MATTVTWLNDDNKTCVLTIQDGSSTTTVLTPAAEPFITSIQESDDLFTPIRSGNGYIRVVVNSVNDIAYLVGSRPSNRKINLVVDGVRVWSGYLACETFTQTWDRGPIEIELPVVTWLECSKASATPLINEIYYSFAKFLYDILYVSNAYDYVVLPNLIDPATILAYKFDLRNYITDTDKNTAREIAPRYNILEDMCKLFGLQAVEYGTTLVFLAADVKILCLDDNNDPYNYVAFTASDLYYIDQGTSRPGLPIKWISASPIIFGIDHDMTWLAGKKSVEVTGQLNEMHETIWSMDVIGQCVYKGSDGASAGSTQELHYYIKKYGVYQSEGASAPNGNIQVYNSIYGMSAPDVNGNNIKYTNWHNNNENAYGGSIGYEKNYWTYNSVISSGTDNWTKRLILRAISGSSYDAISIRTNFLYAPTQNAQQTTPNDAFTITGTLLYAADRQALFTKTAGTRYTQAKLMIQGTSTYYWSPANGWTTTAASFLIRTNDGEIDGYGYYHNGQTLFVPNIPVPKNIEGEVVLVLMAAPSNNIEAWPGTAYLAYEDLAINLKAEQNTRGAIPIEEKEQRENENQKKTIIGGFFTEEWSQDCGLTLAREAVPDSYGAVLNANKEQPGSLYNSKWPEDAMAERASNYYQTSRLRIRAIVQSKNKMLSPLVPYILTSGGQPYILMEQTHNWRTDEVRANFFEPSYNTL